MMTLFPLTFDCEHINGPGGHLSLQIYGCDLFFLI
jgi:hypothetical protein